jgi:Kef-type K+ transport system membrane component KefB
MDLTHLLISLILIFAGAKVLGELAGRIGQPAVLGELAAGVILGVGVLKIVNPQADILVLLADVGVIILLFEAGLATDIKDLLAVGRQSLAVALVGIALPFVGGYFVARAFGTTDLAAVLLGAALTATSVSITVRVLGDLGKLETREAKIILGAAVADDIIALVILSAVRDLGRGGDIGWSKAAIAAAVGIAFFATAIIVGSLFARQLVRLIERMRVSGALIVGAVGFAFAWALAAEVVGSAAIVGAFAAGLALGRTHKSETILADLKPVSYIFTPIFFVVIGAGVDVRFFNPWNASHSHILLIAGCLFLVAVGGKFLAGFAAFGRGIRRTAVGVGMAPRGEVGFIFAEVGRRSGLVSNELFAALVIVVALTTFFTPPLLKFTLAERPPHKSLLGWLFEPARRQIRRLTGNKRPNAAYNQDPDL